MQRFTTVVDWPEIRCLMEVSTMFYICRYSVFTWEGRFKIKCFLCYATNRPSSSKVFVFVVCLLSWLFWFLFVCLCLGVFLFPPSHGRYFAAQKRHVCNTRWKNIWINNHTHIIKTCMLYDIHACVAWKSASRPQRLYANIAWVICLSHKYRDDNKSSALF